MKFDPTAVIETPRLKLRFMRKEDTHDIFVNINSDKEVLLYFLDKYCEKEEEMKLDKNIEFCQQNGRYLFAIELKETGEVIGMILQCSDPNKYFNFVEVGYAIGKKHWGKGYTTEANKAMINFLFEMGIHKVIESHIIENVASKRVIEKTGLTFEGVRKDEVYYHDKYHDCAYYYIINPKQ